MTDHRIVAKWLLQLSGVVASQDPVTRDKITTMVSLLGEQFPDAAYTLRSLEAIAAQSPYWPTYPDLLKRLGEWWREHRPPEAMRLTDDTARGLGGMDLAWLTIWHKRYAEGFGPALPASPDNLTPDQRRANLLSLIRQQSPRAWERITGEQMPAREPRRAEAAA